MCLLLLAVIIAYISLSSSHSSKFYRKVHMLPMIDDLNEHLKMDDSLIPQPVIE